MKFVSGLILSIMFCSTVFCVPVIRSTYSVNITGRGEVGVRPADGSTSDGE
jgi:hypothetical protein